MSDYELPYTGAKVNELLGAVSENHSTWDSISQAGLIMLYAGKTAPSGWLLCDGSAVSRTTYSALYDAIGTTYGSGDGSTTFNLPNMSGRVPVGVSSSYKLGATGGEAAHKLSVSEMPSHSHSGVWTYYAGTQYAWLSTSSGSSIRYDIFNTGASGGDQAHNNMQPYLVMNYVIKVL